MSCVDVELCIKDFEKFKKMVGIFSESNPTRPIQVQEKNCTCDESQWIKLRQFESFGVKDVYLCTKCKGVHICDHACDNLKLTRESWVCSISGIEKSQILCSSAFFNSTHKAIINPTDKCSTCTRIIVGTVCEYNIGNVGRTACEKMEITQEKYSRAIDLVIEKVIFNNHRAEKDQLRAQKANRDIHSSLKKLQSKHSERPSSLIETYEGLLAEYEWLSGTPAARLRYGGRRVRL